MSDDTERTSTATELVPPGGLTKPPDGQVSERQRRSFGKRLSKIVVRIFGTAIGLLILGGVGGVIAVAAWSPRDVIVPVISKVYLPELSADETARILGIIVRAESRGGEIPDLHRRMSFVTPQPNVNVKPFLEPAARGYDDVVTRLEATGKVEAGGVLLDFGINFLEFGRWFLKQFGTSRSQPDVLVVLGFRKKTCNGDQCWEMTYRLHRGEQSAAEHSVTAIGNDTTLTGDLALYLYKRYASEASLSETPFLSVQDLPDTLRVLQAVASGFDDLGVDSVEPHCNESLSQCLRVAQSQFNSALKIEPDYPFGHLGSGLVSLRRAAQAVREHNRMHTIESCLRASALSIRRAIRSRPVLDYLTSESWRKKHSRAFPPNQSELAEFWTVDVSYACANKYFREASYHEQLRFSEVLLKSTAVPGALRAEVQAYALEAKANISQEPTTILDELNQTRSSQPDSWPMQIIFATQACRWKIQFGEAMNALRTARRIAVRQGRNDLVDDGLIWRAYCLWQQEKKNESARVIGIVVDRYPEHGYARSDNLVTIYIDLGYYFTHVGRNKLAAKYFGGAARVPFIRKRVANDPLLNDFFGDDEAMAIFLNKLDNSPPPSVRRIGSSLCPPVHVIEECPADP